MLLDIIYNSYLLEYIDFFENIVYLSKESNNIKNIVTSFYPKNEKNIQLLDKYTNINTLFIYNSFYIDTIKVYLYKNIKHFYLDSDLSINNLDSLIYIINNINLESLHLSFSIKYRNKLVSQDNVSIRNKIIINTNLKKLIIKNININRLFNLDKIKKKNIESFQLEYLKILNCNMLPCLDIFEFICNFPKLKSITIYECKNVNEQKINNINKLKLNTFIFIPYKKSYNLIQYPNITLPKSIVNLELNNNYVNIHLVNQLTQLRFLSKLNFSKCLKIDNNCLNIISSSKKLNDLNLSYCYRITDKGINYLKKLKNLRHLDLSYLTRITDTSIYSLSKIKNLNNLNLSSCIKITNNGFIQMYNLENLHVLKISGNYNLEKKTHHYLSGKKTLLSYYTDNCYNIIN